MRGTVHAQALRRAADMLGGKAKLREFLRVSMSDLEKWMAGQERPPMAIFLKAVDVISAPSASNAAKPGSEELQRAKDLREASEALRAQMAETRERAVAIRKEVLEGRLLRAATSQPVSAAAFLQSKYGPGDGRHMIQAALDAAITATGADMGNVQLTSPEGLRIVAQRGFKEPFLDFFTVVDHRTPATCGAAAQASRRVVVRDVASDPIFAGTAAAAVLAEAGVRAVQSTPLVASDELVGMLSTHYAAPRELSGPDEEVLDDIARRAAYWLDGGSG